MEITLLHWFVAKFIKVIRLYMYITKPPLIVFFNTGEFEHAGFANHQIEEGEKIMTFPKKHLCLERNLCS